MVHNIDIKNMSDSQDNTNSSMVDGETYDGEPLLSSIDFEIIITGLVYGLTFLIGMIGNSLIVYSVLHFRRMKSLSNIFLASLATADLILIIFCVPVKFIQLFSYSWTYGKFWCKFVFYIQNLSAICSVFTLTAMSIERYYAIMYPVECRYICTMSQTKRIIIFTWLSSILLATPVWWTQTIRDVGVEPHKAHWCVRDWDHKLVWQIYECYMLMIILVIPLIIMTYSYAHICNRLWSEMHNRKTTFPLAQMQSQFQFSNTNANLINNNNNNQSIVSTASTTTTNGQSNKQQTSVGQVYIDASANKMSQVIKMLIVVVVIFIACWTPILVVNVLTSFELWPILNYGHYKELKTTFHLLSYANSCVNPIIYGFMSRNFRASFRDALVKCWGRV